MSPIIPPGIRRITARLFHGSEWRHFEQAASLGCQSNTFDSKLNRPEQADYNPRPARLVELMILEGHLEDLTSLCSAALADLAPQDIPDNFHVERQIVSESQNLNVTSNPSRCVEALALVRLLDDVRHMHMRFDSSNDLRDQYTTTIQNLVSRLKHEQNDKLAKKLEAWASRFERRRQR
jgi:hypothetical protein